MTDIKDLRYQVMLALYLPILMYAFSTYDLPDDIIAVGEVNGTAAAPQTVLLGQPFQARALLAIGEKQLTSNTEGIEVVGDSMLQMPTASLLREGQNDTTVSYAGEFSIQQLGGATASYPISGKYTVRRPEVIATSDNAQALYRNSLNRLRFDVPGLENQQLRLRVGSRTVDGRTIALSPSGNSVSVDVVLPDSSSGAEEEVFIGDRQFSVISPPRPELRVLDAEGRPTDGVISYRQPVLQFEITPDEEFRQSYPQDARYRLGQAQIRVRRGGGTAETYNQLLPVNDGRLVLTPALQSTGVSRGDFVQVSVQGMYRINHNGQSIQVPFQEETLSFGFRVV